MSTPCALSALCALRAQVQLIHSGLRYSFGVAGELALDAMRDELLSAIETELLLLPMTDFSGGLSFPLVSGETGGEAQMRLALPCPTEPACAGSPSQFPAIPDLKGCTQPFPTLSKAQPCSDLLFWNSRGETGAPASLPPSTHLQGEDLPPLKPSTGGYVWS